MNSKFDINPIVRDFSDDVTNPIYIVNTRMNPLVRTIATIHNSPNIFRIVTSNDLPIIPESLVIVILYKILKC